MYEMQLELTILITSTLVLECLHVEQQFDYTSI